MKFLKSKKSLLFFFTCAISFLILISFISFSPAHTIQSWASRQFVNQAHPFFSEIDQYDRRYYATSQSCANKTNYINYNQNNSAILNESSYYYVNQFYFSDINNQFRADLFVNLSFYANNSVGYSEGIYLNLTNTNLTVLNNNDNDMISFADESYDTIELQLHNYILGNYTYSKLGLYLDDEKYETDRLTAVKIYDYNVSYLSLSEVKYYSHYNNSYLRGMRNIYKKGYKVEDYLEIDLFSQTYLEEHDKWEFMVPIPWFLYVALMFPVAAVWFWLYTKDIEFLTKLKINIIFGAIMFFLLMMALNVTTVYLMGSSTGSWIFLVLNALLFGVFLNVCGFDFTNNNSENSGFLKYILIALLIVLAISGFGYLGLLFKFNFPFTLFLNYTYFSTSTQHGIYFFTMNLPLFLIIYFVSFLTETEK